MGHRRSGARWGTVVAAVWAGWRADASMTSMSESPPRRTRLRKGWLTVAAAAVVLAAVATYAFVRLSRDDAGREATRQIDRAAEQLRSSSPEQRLAGIESLRSLAAATSRPNDRAAADRVLRMSDELTSLVRTRARPARPATSSGPPGRVDPEVQAALTALGVVLRLIGRGHNYLRIDRVSLAEADLAGADLTGLDLSYVDLSRIDLRTARLTGAILLGATLDAANLRGNDLRGIDVRGASLAGTDLTGANLGGLNLEATTLRGTVLDRADLNGVRFAGAYIDALRFALATGLSRGHILVLTAVNALHSSTVEKRRSGAHTLAQYLRDAPAGQPTVPDPVAVAEDGLVWFVNQHKGPTDTTHPRPPPADVQAALTALFGHPRPPTRRLTLDKAHLQGAALVRANLSNVGLHNANLVGANLRGADLSRSDLWAADLTFADVTGANLTDAAIDTHTLSAVKGLTSAQVAAANLGSNVRFPPGVAGPYPTPTR
jgi:uncharacterized protein YjbI with pentapeptide repeats